MSGRMAVVWNHVVPLKTSSAFAHSEAWSDSQGFRYPMPLKIGRNWIYIIIIHLLQKNPIHNFPGWLSLPFWKIRKRIQFRRSEHAKQCSEIQSLKRHSSYHKTIITDGFCLFSHGVTFLMNSKQFWSSLLVFGKEQTPNLSNLEVLNWVIWLNLLIPRSSQGPLNSRFRLGTVPT